MHTVTPLPSGIVGSTCLKTVGLEVRTEFGTSKIIGTSATNSCARPERVAKAIAKSLQTNPVVVRKILKLLEREGLVALCQGRHGGVRLRRPASRITLGQIYKAVESETGVFAMRSQVHEGCAVACAMKRRLGPIFNAANDAVEQALSKTSLAELVRGVG